MSSTRIRILTDFSLMPIWIERDKKVYADWYGTTVEIGKAVFSEEQDTWMFEEADGLENCYAPEGRFTLSDEMSDGLGDRIDVAINENQGAWFIHQCDDPSECRHVDELGNNHYPCNLCTRNDEPIYGTGHFDYGDHWEAKLPDEDDA